MILVLFNMKLIFSNNVVIRGHLNLHLHWGKLKSFMLAPWRWCNGDDSLELYAFKHSYIWRSWEMCLYSFYKFCINSAWGLKNTVFKKNGPTYLINKYYNFSGLWCSFLLIQMIFGNVNSHSCFTTACRETYYNILPIQCWLCNFHLVISQDQIWLRWSSALHFIFI